MTQRPSISTNCNRPKAQSQRSPITQSEVGRICQAIDYFASKTARSLSLSGQDQQDLRQEIALEILRRLDRFDENRGPFGAFVDMLAAHAAQRLWAGFARRSRSKILVSLDMVLDQENQEKCDRLCVSQPPALITDPWPGVKLHLDLTAVIHRAPQSVRHTFALFCACDFGGTRAPPIMSRTTWYRHRGRLRHWLTAHGLSPPR